jgi:hypothetical protein
MQNAKHAMQNAKPGGEARAVILRFAFPVLRFAFCLSSWRPWRLGGAFIFHRQFGKQVR